MFPPTGFAPQPRKAVFELSTIQERLDRLAHYWTERSGSRLEALLVDSDVRLEVIVQDLVEGRTFRMAWSINTGPIGNDGESHGGARDGGAVEVRRFRVNVRAAGGVGRHSGA